MQTATVPIGPFNAMRPKRSWFNSTGVLAALISLPLACTQAAPRHVYLTWQGDTSRTITVNYQTMEAGAESTVHFDTRSRGGRPGAYRQKVSGSSHQIADLPDGRDIHWVELTGLQPATTYYFIAGDARRGFSAERKFHTVPSGRQTLRFVVGGDMGVSADVADLQRQAARLSPLFGVVGGDIAYANDVLTNYTRWDAWLDHWETNMITPAGNTIPMVLAIGNHEVRGGMTRDPSTVRFFLQYFAQERERSYFSRSFGRNLALYLLDSGHVAAHEGAQAAWLDAQLTAQSRVPHRMAVYHVPLYPSSRAYEGFGSAHGRTNWLPVFDKHRLTSAFEHHDHTFKRSKLLRENRPDPRGTLYLGDGCWGMSARKVDATRRWYEAKAASLQHFWCVDVGLSRVEYRAFSKSGEVFDVYPPNAAGAKAAEKVFKALTQPKPPDPAKSAKSDDD